MPLITTPGDPSADSYTSLVEAKSYWDNVGYDYSSHDDTAIEQALRRGTAWIDATYGPRFIGEPASASQALEWPRVDAIYRGEELPSDQIPQKVKNATSEAASRELTAPGSLSPDYVAAQRVVREKVDVIEVEYSDAFTSRDDILPVVSVVDGLLYGLITSRASMYFGTTARA